MKIVAVDNFNNEAIADVLVAENICFQSHADVMVAALNAHYCKDIYASRHFVVREDSYRLSRGMEDLV